MRVAIYTRVSTIEQATEGYSLEEQSERLKKYSEAMGWNVFKVYSDGGFSGSNMKRPALQSLIKDIKAHKIDIVAVYKLDRLSRSQKDTLYLIEDVMLANDCDFVSMRENFDTSTPFGKAMIGILAVFAQLEREQITERMQMGKDAKAKQGLYHGYNNTPIGYIWEDGLLKVNENESQIVKKIYEMYSQGHSFSSIADYLNKAGLYHYHGTPWSRKVVRNVITSKVYIGQIPHRGQWFDGIHEPIISEELWDDCNRIRADKSNHYHGGVNLSSNSLLSGMLFCAHCGARYGKLTKTITLKKTGLTHYHKYCCNSRAKRTECLVKDPNCKNKIWNMQELDDLVIGEVTKLAINPDLIKESAQNVPKSDLKEPIKAKIEELDSQISKLMDLYMIDGMPLDRVQEKIHALHEQREKLDAELVRIEQIAPKSLSKDVVLQNVRLFSKIAPSGTHDDLKGILNLLIRKIEIDNDDVTIFWNF